MGNFVVYKSSAGSGKTYTLVKEYLKLALVDPDRLHLAFKSILAVTFTNKAATEMKERVLRALHEIASGAQAPLAADLQQEMKLSQSDLQARCEELHSHLLHQYADFSVSTIDAFVYRIVRRFSPDLKLPANFAVETDEETPLWWATDNLLTGMQQNPAVKKLLEAYAEEKIDEQKNWNIEQEIFNLAKSILVGKKDQEGAGLLGEQQIGKLVEVKDSLQEKKSAVEHHLTALAEKAFLLMDKKGIAPEDFYQGKRGIPGYFDKVRRRIYDSEELMNSFVRKALEDDVWYSGKQANPAIDSAKGELLTLINSIEDFREKHEKDYNLHTLLLKNINALCVVSELKLLVDQYKAEKNIVFISEFNKAVSGFISEEPVPYIYERLGDRYKHYLVDEFQDTSSLQWLNLLPLIHNSLSEGKFCMVVGDGKQSIYRWRGADVSQFANLPRVENPRGSEWIAEQQQALQHEYTEKQLNVNRRSRAGVIRFNNSLFNYLAEAQLQGSFKKVYENSAQEPASKEGGRITLSFISETKEEGIEKVLAATYRQVQAALQNRYRFADIAVLVRRNANGNQVANYLMQQGVPVVSSDSLLLKNCPEVNFLTALLGWLVNPNDAVAAVAVIGYLRQTTHPAIDHEVIGQVASRPYLLGEALAAHQVPVDAAKLASLSLFELCTECIRIFRLANRNPLYLNFFLDEISNFSQRESNSIYAFLAWWKQKGDNLSVKIPASTNAVKILTIHASKGLEFPVVIFPFADWKVDASESILIDTAGRVPGLPVALVRTGGLLKKTDYAPQSEEEEQKQALDNLNMLYVACTRAVDELHIIAREGAAGGVTVARWLRQFTLDTKLAGADQSYFESGESIVREHEKPGEDTTLAAAAYRPLHEAVTIKLSDVEDSATSRRVFGIAIHSILAEIRTAADVEAALQKALLLGSISQQQHPAVEVALTQLTQQAQLAKYFAADVQVKTETELFYNNGEIIRPDRVVICEDHVAVIDFKTGEKKPEHVKQIEAYRYALKNVTGKEVKAFLVYLPLEVVEV
jgi:ATP-dependent exoDNAse (exonuclease V) beta subunit